MTYKDILVHVGEQPGCKASAAIGAALAHRFGAHLTGVFLESDLIYNASGAELLSYMPPEAIDQLLREHAAAVKKAGEGAREVFEAAAAEAQVTCDWLALQGERTEPLTTAARRFDLTVFPQSTTATYGLHRLTAAAVAMGSGGPVLVPHVCADAEVGRRILVAWKNTRESARALRDAWPLIMGAAKVSVLVVSNREDAGPDGLLQRHFERHGRGVEVIVYDRNDSSAADVIREHVAKLDADLLVMGVYGRPRLQEFVLGGVSENILNDPPTSLLLAH